MNVNDSLLSKSEVMNRLGIGEKALRRLIREGRLRVVKFGKTSPLKFRQLDLARCLEAPTIFMPCEGRFYTYEGATGIFGQRREEEIAARISGQFLECARACRDVADTSKLEFDLRTSAASCGIIKRAKGLLAVPEDYFSGQATEFIPVANGVLRLSDRQLLPFSPNYRRRHKLAVPFIPGATCPQFSDKLLNPALDTGDIQLIQCWAGLALIGINLSQKMLLLTGTPGGGKSTLVSILTGIIGAANVGLLRTDLLRDRFEIGRLFGKTLLYGPDVSENFLNHGTASILKSLTGGRRDDGGIQKFQRVPAN